MRAVWICVLLLQAWAAPLVFASAAHLGSGTSDVAVNNDGSLQNIESLEVDSEAFRTLLKKKKSGKKSSKKPSKKPSKKSSKKTKKPSKKSKKKSPVRGKPGKKGKKGASGTPGSAGVPGVPGIPGVPATNGIPGTSGAPGSSGTPGQPGAPGRPGSVAAFFSLGTPVTITTEGYTGPAVDGTASDIAKNGLPSNLFDVILSSEFNTLVGNSTALNEAVLKVRAAIAAALDLYDENGNLALYQVELVSVSPGSVVLRFKVYTPSSCSAVSPLLILRLSRILTFARLSCPPPTATPSPSPAAGRR